LVGSNFSIFISTLGEFTFISGVDATTFSGVTFTGLPGFSYFSFTN